VLVAAIVGCLGLSSVVRAPAHRHAVRLLGVASLLWGLHTLWSVLPAPLLGGVHEGIWWNAVLARRPRW
jgi:hypothetical protein